MMIGSASLLGQLCTNMHILCISTRPALTRQRDEHRSRSRRAGARPRRDRRPEARRHRAAEPAGQPRGGRSRLRHRLPARRRDRRERFPGRRARDRGPERADGLAVGRGRARRLPAAVPRRPARLLGHPLHADGDGDRADDPDHADHRRAVAAGRRRRLAGISRAAALARRDAARRRDHAAVGPALLAGDDRARRLRPRGIRSRRGDDRRRQHRRRDARDDDDDRAGDQQGRSAAGARARHHPAVASCSRSMPAPTSSRRRRSGGTDDGRRTCAPRCRCCRCASTGVVFEVGGRRIIDGISADDSTPGRAR